MFVGLMLLSAASNSFASQPLTMLDQRAIANKPVQRYEFEMTKKPWRDVFVWLVEKYDLPMSAGFSPKGTFTFIGPKGKTYTLSQILDIVNKALLAQEGVIIRGKRSLMFLPISEVESGAAP